MKKEISGVYRDSGKLIIDYIFDDDKINIFPNTAHITENIVGHYGWKDLCELPSGIRSKWIAMYPFSKVVNIKCDIIKNSFFINEIWNGSYHDCHYFPGFIVSWGRRPGTARKRLLKVLSTIEIKPSEDSSIRRFKSRNLVRSGD